MDSTLKQGENFWGVYPLDFVFLLLLAAIVSVLVVKEELIIDQEGLVRFLAWAIAFLNRFSTKKVVRNSVLKLPFNRKQAGLQINHDLADSRSLLRRFVSRQGRIEREMARINDRT